jgi:hypothetical protein
MKFEIHFEFRAGLRKFQDLNFWDATQSGHRIADLTPRLFRTIPKQRANRRTVLDALSNHSWISDIQGAFQWVLSTSISSCGI